jgi:SAM-dependent methyltransferase
MDDKAPTTPPPSPLPGAAPDASAQPGKEVAVEHDTTLKWIVNEMGELQPTPPPRLEVKRERPAPTLPPPARGTLTPAPREAGRHEAGSGERTALDGPKTPEPAPASSPSAGVPPAAAGPPALPPKPAAGPQIPPPPPPAGQPLPPSAAAAPPARTVPPLPPPTAAAGAEGRRKATPAAELVGATPAALAMPDPTPKTDSPSVSEAIGAAPVAMLPGPTGSDSELAADAVELIPSATEDVGAVPTQVAAPETNDTPREGVVPVDPRPAPALPTEPREVEPEVVVEVMESAEHNTAPTQAPPPAKPRAMTPPPVARPRAVTPPPVPAESIATTPPPVPPQVLAAHAAQTERPPEPATAIPPPVPPETVTAHVAQAARPPEPASAPPPVPPEVVAAHVAQAARPPEPASAPPPVPPEAVAAHVAQAARPPEAPTASPPPVPPEVVAARAAQAARLPELTANLFDEGQTPGTSDENLPEALARRSLQKRSKPWYEEVFDEDFLRTLPFMTPEQTAREAAFIREALALPKAGEVLDVACGYGRHALELAQQGFRVTGLDLSLPLLIRAADDAQRRGLTVNFVHADMREMSFGNQFDGAYCALSSFGYFDEETNLRVATAICRALKPGGRFLLDIINRDYIVSDLPSRVWWEGDGCVVLEEVDFNYHTSRVLVRRSVAFGNGRQSEQEISMRAYSLHEVGKLLRQAGLRVLEISGGLATKARFFGAASRNIIAVCERPSS